MITSTPVVKTRNKQPDFVRKAGPHRNRRHEERRTARTRKHKARLCAWES